MSYVTNIIVSTSILDEEKMADINTLLFQQHGGADLLPVREEAGGNKFLEATVYLAAYKQFDLDKCISSLRLIKWEDPAELQLFVKGEDDERFREVEVFPEQHPAPLKKAPPK